MAKKPVFDFKLEQAPRVRERQDWAEVAQDTRALGAADLADARVLALDRVEPGPWQVRRDFHPAKMAELVESVRAQGVLEPILVRAAEAGRYQIIAGERRYRAACEAGLPTIPARVLEIDDVGARVIGLMENIQRDDLNEVERAEGLVALKELTRQTWEEVGRLLGISRRHVLHLVSLTRLPEEVQSRVRSGQLSAKHGRLLAYVKDPAVQVALAELIAELRLNARQTAEVVKRLGGEPGFTRPERAGEECPDADELRQRLSALVLPLLEPAGAAPAPAPAPPAAADSDPEPLLAAIADTRRALAACPESAIDDALAARLQHELDALIEAARSLLARLPQPPACP
jgi:ParB family chromosome partitioning protein